MKLTVFEFVARTRRILIETRTFNTVMIITFAIVATAHRQPAAAMTHGTCSAMTTNPARVSRFACVVVIAVGGAGAMLLYAKQSVAPTGRIADDIIVAAVISRCW